MGQSSPLYVGWSSIAAGLGNLGLGPPAWEAEQGPQTCSTTHTGKFWVKGRGFRGGRSQTWPSFPPCSSLGPLERTC